MDVYDKLGVKKLINAAGTLTGIGSSLMRPEVLAAMTEASKYFVDMHELHQKVGERIANMLGVEAAFVTSGAAAGLLLATAACMTRGDPEKIRRLPNTDGIKNKIITFKCHRHVYDKAIETAGAQIVEIGLVYTDRTHAWELEAAIDGQTAAISYCAACEHLPGSLPLKEVIKIARQADVPVIVDAAAELPPVSNLRYYNDLGADLVVFSGGKDIRGPQSAGLILGRKDLVEACALNSCPYHNVIGRPLKVDKETLIGMLVALELYLEEDHDARMAQWKHQVNYLVDRLSKIPFLSVEKGYEVGPGIQPTCIPRVYIEWDKGMFPVETKTIVRALRNGDPAVVVAESPSGIVINPHMLQKGEEEVVANRLIDAFHRVKKGGENVQL